MAILVTGATGTVGRYVVQLLAESGQRVFAGVHDADRASCVMHPHVEIVEIDFSDEASIEAALNGMDKVYLLTPSDAHQVEMAKRVIDLMYRNGSIQHVVRQSAMGAEVIPGIQLLRWHREIDEHLIDSRLPYTILRSNSFMENILNYHGEGIRRQNTLYMPLGEARVSFIAARDVAAVAVAVLSGGEEHLGKTYTLTGPEAISGQDIANALTHATGRTISYVDVPEEEMRKAMTGAPRWQVDGSLELYAFYRADYGSRMTNTAEQLIGHPSTDFRSWAREHAEAFDTHGQRAA